MNKNKKILEKNWEYNEAVHQLFTDLYNILIEFGIPRRLVRLIKMCLSKPIAESG
jgi:hypothetical protein